MPGLDWSDDEIARLRKYIDQGLTPTEIGNRLKDRSVQSIKHKARRLGEVMKEPPKPIVNGQVLSVWREAVEESKAMGRCVVYAVADDPADARRFLDLMAFYVDGYREKRGAANV